MHFVVGVITETGSAQEIDALLERYDENLTVQPFVAFTKDEFLKQKRDAYQKDLVSKRYKEYLDGQDQGEFWSGFFKVLPEIAGIEDDAEFIRRVTEIENIGPENFDEHGNLLGFSNPDGMYDWYEIGGRWEGALPLKNGRKSSSEKCSEIDFRQKPEVIKNHLNYWERVVEGKPQKNDKDGKQWGPSKESLLSTYKSKEAYLAANSLWVPNSFVNPDGEWIQLGFDFSREEHTTQKDIEKHHQALFDLIEKYSDYYFTIVDCHC